jgi:hypothetical protein
MPKTTFRNKSKSPDDMDGKCVAHGFNKKMIGKELIVVPRFLFSSGLKTPCSWSF